MLKSLSIDNFLVIKKAVLALPPVGMIAITGESGAGKSTILEALKLACGARFHQEYRSDNGKNIEVNATFDTVEYPEIVDYLQTWNVSEMAECVLRRVIHTTGRSSNYVNDHQVPLYVLQQIAQKVLYAQDQHESIFLKKKERQIKILDYFIDQQQQGKHVKKIWDKYLESKRQLKHVKAMCLQHEENMDLWTYQMEEIEALDVQQDEWHTLERQHTLLEKKQECEQIYGAVLEIADERDQNIRSLLSACIKKVETIPHADTVNELLSQALICMEEVVNTIREKQDFLIADEEQTHQIKERLSCLYAVARKHHVMPDRLLDIYQEIKKSKDQLETYREQCALLEKEVLVLEKSFFIEANKLSVMRCEKAPLFTEQVNQVLSEMDMQYMQFKVLLEPEQMGEHGVDHVVFQVNNNHQSDFFALHKIVSGGELSRINLAIQIVVARYNRIKTCVFDEVDIGFSGAVSAKVGHLLARLGEDRQIFCITHQAQIASRAACHVSVYKTEEQEAIITSLQETDRKHEIARMIAGVDITSNALAHAKEMIRSK